MDGGLSQRCLAGCWGCGVRLRDDVLVWEEEELRTRSFDEVDWLEGLGVTEGREGGLTRSGVARLGVDLD